MNDYQGITPRQSLFTALVVEPNDVDAVFILSTLSSVGFDARLAHTFEQAKRTLIQIAPLVLVTEIRLGAYNGLHLALHAAATRRCRTVLVTSSYNDPVLARDTEQAGATFVLKPVTSAELIAAVYRTALRRPNPDGSVLPVRPPFERRTHNRRVQNYAALGDAERRRSDRRHDIGDLLLRSAMLS